jgi:hypothetical protein
MTRLIKDVVGLAMGTFGLAVLVGILWFKPHLIKNVKFALERELV